MPRYTLKSVAEADRQYANLPEYTRRLVDRCIQELLENPTGNPDKQYDSQFDQWSIPIGAIRDGSFMASWIMLGC